MAKDPEEPVSTGDDNRKIAHFAPAAFLDGSQPIVEIDTDRLNDAMTWLYAAVRSLQQQGAAIGSHLVRLEGVMQECLGTGGMDVGIGTTGGPPSARGDASAIPPGNPSSPTAAGGAEASSPSAPQAPESVAARLVRLEREMRHFEKVLDSRLDAAGVDDNNRLFPKDSDSLRAVGQAGPDARAPEDAPEMEVGERPNQLGGDKTNAFSHRRASFGLQVDVTTPIAEALGDVDQRLRTLEGSNVPSPLEEAPPAGNDEASGNSTSVLQAWCQDMQRRVEVLELHGGGGSDGGEALHNQLMDFHKQHNDAHYRLLEAERRLASLEGLDSDESGAGAIRSPDVEASPAAEEEMVDAAAPADEKVAEEPIVKKREKRKERAPAQAGESGDGAGGAGGGGGGMKERMRKLEGMIKEMHDDMEYMEKRFMQSDKSSKEQFKFVLKSVETLAQLVSGGEGDDSRPESRPSSTGDGDHMHELKNGDLESAVAGMAAKKAKGEDALAWLDKRVSKLLRKTKGMSLEARIRELEKANEVGGGIDYRLASMERDIKSLDVKSLRQVRPDLVDYRQEYESFADNLRRDMKELKVVVGCLEACVPRETRKAVDLFKRAAGSEHISPPASPQEFEVGGQILALRDDMDQRLRAAQTSVKDQCEHVVHIVRGVEKRQDQLAWELQKLLGGAIPPPEEEAEPPRSRKHTAMSGVGGPPPGWART